MKLRIYFLIILSGIILLVECSGKISKKVTDVNTGIAEGTGKISGKVTDVNTGKALAGSNVIIIGKRIGAATDTNGFYTISNVPPGSYSMQARKMWYKSVNVIEVNVVGDSTTIIDFKLASAIIKDEGVKLGPK
jgi:hypothetical protein